MKGERKASWLSVWWAVWLLCPAEGMLGAETQAEASHQAEGEAAELGAASSMDNDSREGMTEPKQPPSEPIPSLPASELQSLHAHSELKRHFLMESQC